MICPRDATRLSRAQRAANRCAFSFNKRSGALGVLCRSGASGMGAEAPRDQFAQFAARRLVSGDAAEKGKGQMARTTLVFPRATSSAALPLFLAFTVMLPRSSSMHALVFFYHGFGTGVRRDAYVPKIQASASRDGTFWHSHPRCGWRQIMGCMWAPWLEVRLCRLPTRNKHAALSTWGLGVTLAISLMMS